MILQILGLAMIVIATYHIGKTAKEYGRNVGLWVLMALAVGFGFQWIVPIFLGIVLAIIYLASGTPQSELESAVSNWAIILTFVCFGLSLAGLIILLKLVSRVPDEPTVPRVPPPPTFNEPDSFQ